ncbi:MAG: hypothetical protein JO138_26315 [Acidobacteriaceae bacterium]|nr:hypothetical protein [Acidobacteriaceae bacterium]
MTKRLYVTLLAVPLAGGVSLAAPQATNGTEWTPYSAHYTETVSSQGPSGNQTHKNSEVDELRSEDGSVLSISKVGGNEIKGKLWLASGEIDDLDYTRQQAIVSGHAPRTHLPVPKVSPTGNEVVAGLPCSDYPVSMRNGGGQLCVDVADDILLKEEIHVDANGVRTEYVKQASSVDLSTPVDSSKLRIPANFKKLTVSPGGKKQQ